MAHSSSTPLRRSRRQRGADPAGYTPPPSSIRATSRTQHRSAVGPSPQSIYNLRGRQVALAEAASSRNSNLMERPSVCRCIEFPTSKPIQNGDETFSVSESLQVLMDGGDLYHTLDDNLSMQSLQGKFLDSLTDHPSHGLRGLSHCPQCKERWFDTNLSLVRAPNRSKQCTKCFESAKQNSFIMNPAVGPVPIRLLSGENNMDPCPRFLHFLLPKLSPIEEMLIAWVHPFMRVFRLDGGMLGYKGNVANLEQDIDQFVTVLPTLPADLPCVVVKKPSHSAPSGFHEFKVSRRNIMAWLDFLKRHNPFYANIDLDVAQLRCERIPEDGSLVDSLPVMLEGGT